MLKFYNYDIVFQEIPDETTMAVNITNCPNHCPDCHSRHLWKDIGTPLDAQTLTEIVSPYRDAITCFCFMGGDGDLKALNEDARLIRQLYPGLKIGWYSGKEAIPNEIDLKNFDFIKTGRYDSAYGPLKKKTTNQRLYRIMSDGTKTDITATFWKS